MIPIRIAVLPGDGIGPEVITASLDVLRATEARLAGVRFELNFHAVGAGEYLKNGHPMPATTVAAFRQADAILLGAMGLPGVRWPNGVEMTPQIDIREQLDLYNGVRPIKLYHESHTPLKHYGGTGPAIDFVIVRENCEGLFSDRLTPRPPGREFETDTLTISRRGTTRICRAAFRLAQQRRRHVTLVDKANVLPSMAFFRQVFDAVAAEFPDVQTDRVYVDAMALFLVQRPHTFDVIVTENMFGDILSDLAAGLVGGMGMAPSADLGERHGVFQPSHGTAPTIAGKGIANPIATILSVALMLDWLGHVETRRGARLIETAVATVLANPSHRTADLGGNVSTAEITRLICEALP
ncbi:isocitrate/isopropylmalate dehydrogenase family protein [Horticoccus sp. 23ND18S-11]|uniref:isocitrate/isopropylmalate dehydrogenase family protein n=1 Tax=Horticoccus sp. 23ND18S-11 TaxID=3391832 RepID=UPI0039C9CBF9